MDKTRILLVFGQHGKPNKPASPQTKNFFRKAVSRFLKEEVLGRGRKVAVIHELVITPDEKFSIGPGRRENISPQDIAKDQQEVSSDLKEWLDSFNRGKAARPLRNEFNVTFGYIDEVLAMNAQVPGSVKNHFEPNCPQAIYENMKANWIRAQVMRNAGVAISEDITVAIEADPIMLDAVTEMVRLQLLSAHRRDQGILGLCQSLRESEPGQSILVVRGLGHVGMSSFLDRNEYEVKVETEVVDDRSKLNDPDELIRLYTAPETPEGIERRVALELRQIKVWALEIVVPMVEKVLGKGSIGRP